MRRISFLIAVVALIAPAFAVNNAIPTVNQPLFPSSVKPGSAAFTLMVDGSAFAPGAVVNWNGVPLTTRFVNRSRLRATVPAANVAVPGTATVTVTNPAPGGGTSFPVFFTVTTPSTSLTFAALPGFSVGTTVSQVVAADFNNDGKMDLAVLNQGAEYTCDNSFDTIGSEYVSTFLGNGDGTFTAGGSLQLDCVTLDGGADYALTVADFNGDGHPDLAVSFTGTLCCIDFGHFVGLYLGNGDGTFSAQPSAVVGSVGDEGGSAAIGDFNGDGYADVAIEGSDLGTLLWFLGGNGQGGLGLTALTDVNPAINLPGGWLADGDFNNDGFPDIVSPPAPDNTPTIFLGVGDGTFTPASAQPSLAQSANAPALGDFNGDGNLDLAVTDGSTALTVLLGNGDGTFLAETGEPNDGPYAPPLAADLNGDGRLDLAVGPIYLGNGDGTFQTGLDIGFSGAQVAVADFNGDGRLDLVTLNAPNTITILVQAPAAVALPGSLKFGKVAVGKNSNPLRVTLTNSGSAALHLSSFIASGDFSQTNNCGETLPLGQTCSIQVVFRPTEFGLRTGNITITDNASDSPQVIQLSGTGIAGFD